MEIPILTIKGMLGQSPNIERLSQYIDKENWGESTFQQALNQIDIFHEDNLNNKNKVFRHENGSIKDFEMNKNSMKIMSAFKLVRQLPETFEPIRQNLMNDMSNAFYNPEITYASLVKEAEKRAKATGQMNIFSEYKIPEQKNGLSRYDRKVFKKGITDQQEPKDERKALLKYITDNDTGEETVRENPTTWNIIKGSAICAFCITKKCRQKQLKFKRRPKCRQEFYKLNDPKLLQILKQCNVPILTYSNKNIKKKQKMKQIAR